ncbi:GlcNAc-PI de-N-acetylase [Barrientosiimonas humi]|uniref:GlcNAc-PI de-N-acetylase n=1 Tax=Barrientosiimonas humi TaxID=999931 RepID=A0A542XDZ9_9MICO|nr:PIG-L family deacetylase [Barrientosiimonas humi]TQL34059.1 GlcNAc-PI de-N-acetylase [Barrientosiimonas humi]CAG7574049.1 hypothetical protein BH39T_PBIAJDOK_02692 [Barrientosiimonas humi]
MSGPDAADDLTPVLRGRPVLVLAPHLDDAWLSAAAVLQRAECTVWTVFAGSPSPAQSTPWDAASGFADSDETMSSRTREDEAAFAGTPHGVERLPLLDATYADHALRGQDRQELGRRLDTWLTSHPGAVVVAPVGAGVHVPQAVWQVLRERVRRSDDSAAAETPGAAPSAAGADADEGTAEAPSGALRSAKAVAAQSVRRVMHADAQRRRRKAQRRGMAANPDHLLVRDVALATVPRHAGATLVLSEDLPYLWHERGAVQARRLHRHTAGLREVTAPVDVADKHARLQAYTSQLPVLDEQGRLGAADLLPVTETYWIVDDEDRS